MIDYRIKRAIGRLKAIWNDRPQPTSGTAFLVSSRHILTAFHVVADRFAWVETGEKRFADQIQFTLSESSDSLRAAVVANCADGDRDWALLELELDVVGVDPLPLGDLEGADLRQPSAFVCWGYPVAALSAQGGVVVGGRVKDWHATYQGMQAIELHSDFPAPTLRGLSGAPCIVDGAAVGIVRATLAMSETTTYVGATAYACPVSSLDACCWDLIAPPDPIWGLPGLPTSPKLPPKPFRDLRCYGEEHAALFFGRGAAIRELYHRLVDPQRPRLIYLYGHSGVGKSSLLRAGLYPRISSRMTVTIGQRLRTEPLAVTFSRLYETATASREHTAELVLIDQVEEAYTDTRTADADEDLSRLLNAVSAALDRSPELRVLLTFRAEWLAELKTSAERANLVPAYMHLLPLDEDGIEQVVLGIRRTALKRVYDMNVDDGLASRVSAWLLSDNNSPISPMLSIVMTRLWDRAEKSGRRSLSLEAFDAMTRDKLDLDQFVQDQIGKVRAEYPEPVDSGLVLDLLFSLTTEHGTTQDVAVSRLTADYAHIAMSSGAPDLQRLLTSLEAHSLIYTTTRLDGSGPVKRLAHDTLATPVRKAFAASVLPGQKARRLIEARVAMASDAKNSVIDPATLSTILSGRQGMRTLRGDEHRIVEAAKVAKARSIRRVVLVSGTVLSLLGSVLLVQAVRSSAVALSDRGLALISDKRPDQGLPLLRLAYAVDGGPEIQESLIKAHRLIKGLRRTSHPFGHGAVEQPPAYISHDDLFETVAFPTPSGFMMGRLPKTPRTSDGWFVPVGVAGARMVALDGTGKCLAVATSSSVHVIATPGKRCGRTMVLNTQEAELASVALSDTQVFAGTREGQLLIWSDLSKIPKVRTLSGASASCQVTHIAISHASTTIAVGCDSGNVWVGIPEQVGQSAPLSTGMSGRLNAIAISNDGRSVAVVRDNGMGIEMLTPESGPYKIPIQGSTPASVAFSPDARLIALGQWDGTLSLWDVSLRTPFVEYPVQLGAAMRLHFNASGSELTAWTIYGGIQTYAARAYPISRLSGPKQGKLKLFQLDDGVMLLDDTNGIKASLRHAPDGWFPGKPTGAQKAGRRAPDNDGARRAVYKALDLPEVIKDPLIWTATSSGLDKIAALDIASKSIRGRAMSSSILWKTEPSVYGAKDLHFAPDGRWLVAAEDEFVRYFDAGNGKLIGSSWTTGEKNAVEKLLVDDGGRFVAAASAASLSIWPTPETSLVETLSVEVPAASQDETIALLGPVMGRLIPALAKLRMRGH